MPESFGGVEQVINQIAIGTTKLGYKNDVLSLTADRYSKKKQFNGYDIHYSPLDFQIASTSFSWYSIFHFAELAKKADLIHYHFPWPFMDLVHFLNKLNKPTVLTYHSDIIRQKYLLNIYRPLMIKFLNEINHIVATSPNYLNTSNTLNNYLDKVSVIPIGLDKKNYPIPSPIKLSYWRNRLGPKFFLFIGVMRYYKGLHILIEAARSCDYPIVIIGAGPIEAELKKHAQRIGVRNICFLGQLLEEDKVAILKLSYGVVFPSHLRSEAFGISLLEGAMYGKPLISCEIGTGTTFINIASETGLVIPPNDPSALYQAMHYLWEYPLKAAEMGIRARERYCNFFTAEKMNFSYSELYRTLITKNK
jgi:O-antigen biosynthesis rhamnosyltransferase